MLIFPEALHMLVQILVGMQGNAVYRGEPTPLWKSLKVVCIVPPLQPRELVSHCSAYCSDKSYLVPLVPIASKLSYWPIAAKAQQAPHDPWFLTGVTRPKVRQSNAAGEVNNRLLVTGLEDMGIFNLVGSQLKNSKNEATSTIFLLLGPIEILIDGNISSSFPKSDQLGVVVVKNLFMLGFF